MEELLKFLVTAISKDIEFDVVANEVNGITIYTITTAKENMGLLIGKEGKTINAIRTLLKVRATLENLRVNVELLEK